MPEVSLRISTIILNLLRYRDYRIFSDFWQTLLPGMQTRWWVPTGYNRRTRAAMLEGETSTSFINGQTSTRAVGGRRRTANRERCRRRCAGHEWVQSLLTSAKRKDSYDARGLCNFISLPTSNVRQGQIRIVELDLSWTCIAFLSVCLAAGEPRHKVMPLFPGTQV